ncbi:collagen alpha-1(I) chain [Malaya genurostris]|uniref:collagen alpha-1(I) chain n=1 Tax=Malaya genurostris TaxID=325434 RepID=UPI0026F3BFE1|nr:collagen alpha-1(I) chain [Malaya genurostris]
MKPFEWALFITLCLTVEGVEFKNIEQVSGISGVRSSFDATRNSPLSRVKRNNGLRGSFRGQTQSQYLHFGDSQDGKAEAEATQHGSRAVVVGSNGMGQAQSQSMGGDCSSCLGTGVDGGSYVYDSRPDPLKAYDGTGDTGFRPGGDSFGTFGQPGILRPAGGLRPGDASGSGVGTDAFGRPGTGIVGRPVDLGGTAGGDSYGRPAPGGRPGEDYNGRPGTGRPGSGGGERPGGPVDSFGRPIGTDGRLVDYTSGADSFGRPIGPGGRPIDRTTDSYGRPTNGQPGAGDQTGRQDFGPSHSRDGDSIGRPTGSDGHPGYDGRYGSGSPGQDGRYTPGPSGLGGGPGSVGSQGGGPGPIGSHGGAGTTGLPTGAPGFTTGTGTAGGPGVIGTPGVGLPGTTVSQTPGASPGFPGGRPIGGPGTIGVSGGSGGPSSPGTPGYIGSPGSTVPARNGQSRGPDALGGHIINGKPGGQPGITAVPGSTSPGYSGTGQVTGGPQSHIVGPPLQDISSRRDQPSTYHSGAHSVTLPGHDHTVVNPTGGLTVLVGTGSPKQTIIGSDSRLDGQGPVKIIPGPPDSFGPPKQTVYAHPGGVTVLVGTGGPHQTVHHLPAPGTGYLPGSAGGPQQIHTAGSHSGTGQQQYPVPGQIPAAISPTGQQPTGPSSAGQWTGGPGSAWYPAGYPGIISGQYPVGGGPIQYPGVQGTTNGIGQYPGKYPATVSGDTVPTGVSGPSIYPGQPGRYPTTSFPGVSGGQYPHTDLTGKVPGYYPTGTGSSQYPGSAAPSQYQPGVGPHPGSLTAGTGVQQTGVGIAPIEAGKYPVGTTHGQHVGGTGTGTTSGQYPVDVGTQHPARLGPGYHSGGVGTGQRPAGGSAQYPGDTSQYPGSGPTGQQHQVTGGGIGQYPGGVGSIQYPVGRGDQYPGQYPGGVATGQVPAGGTGVSQYPGGAGVGQYPVSGTGVGQYPGGVATGQLPASGTGVSQYPGGAGVGQHPGSGGPVGVSQYPGISGTGQHPGGGGTQYPGGAQYTSGAQYPGGAQYPSGPQYPSGAQYPGGVGAGQQPGGTVSGAQYPDATGVSQYPGRAGADQHPVGGGTQYPVGAQYPSGGQYPGSSGAVQYPASTGAGQYPVASGAGHYPGVGDSGRYPTASTGAGQYPEGVGAGQYPGGASLHPSTGGGIGVGQYPGTGTGVGHVTGGYPSGQSPASIDQYPSTLAQGGSGTGTGSTGVGEPASIQVADDDDDSFSQAESSVKNGEVIASAQGRKNGGTAQTQVSGTYDGTGSFSASAQTSDSDRAAQAQVSGGKEGALSSAQGTGGVGKSQSQVQVNSKTGGTSATSQSGGLGHESQSEVVANEKGGLADAQSSGPGQTSSQAQIGFRPQAEENSQQNIFNGGGQASAQSGAHSGQSQSQISGNFKFGISYHGAAQAASGTKEQVSRYREKGKQLFHSIGLFGKTNNGVAVRRESDVVDPNGLRLRTSQQSQVTDFHNILPKPEEEVEYEEEDEEYEEEDYETTDRGPIGVEAKSRRTSNDDEEKKTTIVELPPPTVPSSSVTTTVRPNRNYNVNNGNGKTFSQNTSSQKQVTSISDLEKYRLVQTQNGKTTVHETSSEKVPEGFTGISGGQSSTGADPTTTTVQVTSSTPKYHTRYLPSKHLDSTGNRIATENKQQNPDSYISVTKQVTGIDENSKVPAIPGKNYESTYYTKSSTCGYFTFSCNIVYGATGRSKICRPKPPTNGKC